jgi:hypothetical protein
VIAICVSTALAMAGLAIWSARRNESKRLETPRRPLLTVPVQIICGDCSGQKERPLRTCLSVDGACESCGGRSFTLASAIGAARIAHYSYQSSAPSPLRTALATVNSANSRVVTKLTPISEYVSRHTRKTAV